MQAYYIANMTYVIHTLSGSHVGKNPPDGGWGWVVVFAAFFIDALAFSAVKGIGLFYNDIMRDLELNNSETSLIVSLLAGVFGLAGEFLQCLVHRNDNKYNVGNAYTFKKSIKS